MSSQGTEELKAALRRSLALIVGLVIAGIVIVNIVEQIEGATYQAVSQVEVSATPLAQVVSGTQPSYVDPQRSQDTAAALAKSPAVYQIAATRPRNALGQALNLQHRTTVGEVADTDIISFTSTAASSARAQRLANTVAQAFVTFSGRSSAQEVTTTISKLTGTLDSLPAGAQRTQVQNELNRLKILQGASSSNAAVVQQAVTADKTSPAPAKDTALGLGLGLIVALIIVAIREVADTKVRSANDVEDILNAPVITRVRPLPKRTRMVSYGVHEMTFGDAYALLAARLVPARRRAESTVIAVSSTVAQEGKTTTAANLAVAIARRGGEVILADFDFRKPDVPRLFGIPSAAPGTLQVARGEMSAAQALWRVTLNGSSPKVTPGTVRAARADRGKREESDPEGSLLILPAGGTVSPARNGAVKPLPLEPLLRALRGQAGTVILDTPPALLTADMTDFAAHVDAVVIVIRQGYASRRNLRLLAEQTAHWKADVAGIVLTDVALPSQLSTYYGAPA